MGRSSQLAQNQDAARLKRERAAALDGLVDVALELAAGRAALRACEDYLSRLEAGHDRDAHAERYLLALVRKVLG